MTRIKVLRDRPPTSQEREDMLFYFGRTAEAVPPGTVVDNVHFDDQFTAYYEWDGLPWYSLIEDYEICKGGES